VITRVAVVDVCQFDEEACWGGRGRTLAPVVSGDGRWAGQCPSCSRVWYVKDGTPTWVWDFYHGGYLPAADPRATGWRRVARYWRLQLRARLPRWRRDCGERLPRLRRF
jgi:hypothetical protein